MEKEDERKEAMCEVVEEQRGRGQGRRRERRSRLWCFQ